MKVGSIIKYNKEKLVVVNIVNHKNNTKDYYVLQFDDIYKLESIDIRTAKRIKVNKNDLPFILIQELEPIEFVKESKYKIRLKQKITIYKGE